MSRLSIRWRLTLWYGAVLATVLAVFGVSVYLMMRHLLLARTGTGMSMEATEVAEEVARARDRSDPRHLAGAAVRPPPRL